MENINALLVQYTNDTTGLDLSPQLNQSELIEKLVDFIQHLMTNNFERLIQLLYRLDVSETQLKSLLLDAPQTDAALLISQLIVQRQLQKLASRKANASANFSDTDEEKW